MSEASEADDSRYDALIRAGKMTEAYTQAFRDCGPARLKEWRAIKDRVDGRAYVLARAAKPKEFLDYYDSRSWDELVSEDRYGTCLLPFALIAYVWAIWQQGYQVGLRNGQAHPQASAEHGGAS